MSLLVTLVKSDYLFYLKTPKLLFHFITHHLEPFACLIFCITLAFYCRSNKQSAIQLLSVYYLVAAILLTIASFSTGPKSKSNIWMYDLVALCTSVSIGIYFYRLLQSPQKKITVAALTVIYLVYVIARNVTLKEMRLFDSIGYSIISASVACYVFMYYHQLLKNVSEVSILGEFNFWLASGYLIYFVGSFIIFVSYYYLTNEILSTYTKEERHLLTALWGMHNILLFISAMLLFTGCLWVTYRRK